MNYAYHHTAISVRNLEKSCEFYQKLGFKQVHRYNEPDGSLSIVHMKLGNAYLEIFAYEKNVDSSLTILEQPNNLDEIGIKHIALATADIESALADLINKGLASKDTKIVYGETEVCYFFVTDPDGLQVEIVKDGRYN